MSTGDGQSGRLRVSATDVYRMLSGPKCERRVYLNARGVEGEEPSAFGRMLRDAGMEHEMRHLESLMGVTEPFEGTFEERAAYTRDFISKRRGTLYQGVLLADHVTASGMEVSLRGIPDFLIPSADSYVIRDAKMARSVEPDDRRDIDAQLQVYGYMYEILFGDPPPVLEIVSGDDVIHTFEYRGRIEAAEMIDRVVDLKLAAEEPICDVKWSDRDKCEYAGRCWEAATQAMQLSVLPKLSRSAVRVLRTAGIETIPELLDAFDGDSLSEVEIPHGSRTHRIGKHAHLVMHRARALTAAEQFVFAPLELPAATNVVLFDLEGISPLGTSDGYIYLWGTSVHGDRPLPYHAALALSSAGLDEEAGWHRFLERARLIHDQYGGIPWLHWASYEKTHMRKYIERFGDPDGTAGRVLDSLVDLLRVLEKSVALPLHSYSLKVVEDYVGFERSQSEIGGAWSITVWQEAIAMSDSDERAGRLGELETYNKEDLEGMAAVYEFMRTL